MTERTAPASHVIGGVVWMVGASVFFAASIVVARELIGAHTMFVMAFVQSLVVAVAMLPWMMRAGRFKVSLQNFWVYLLRAASAYIAMATMFFSLEFMPVADVTALLFSGGLFTVLLAALFLREPVGVRRWAAVIAGFGGALVIIQPGFAEISWPVLMMLVSALGFGAVNATARLLAYAEDANAIIFHTFGLMLILSIGPAAYAWTTPGLIDGAWLIVLGLVTVGAQQCVVRSLAAAAPAITMPAYYLQLPFAAVIAYFAFEETPGIWIWVGAGIICAATYYIVRIESAAQRGRPNG